MWEQIRSNQIRSVVLVAGMAGLLLVIGYFVGLAFFGSGTGGLIVALLVWGVMNLVAFFERLEAAPINARMMNKYVRTVFSLN